MIGKSTRRFLLSFADGGMAKMAGLAFKIRFEQAEPLNLDLLVTLEKQRVVTHTNSGAPELRPTGGSYFDADAYPKPIVVPAGQLTANSEPICVRRDAHEEINEAPLKFPEFLLITGFASYPGSTPDAQETCCLFIDIYPFEQTPLNPPPETLPRKLKPLSHAKQAPRSKRPKARPGKSR